jgi:hypothetical protein
MGFDISVDERIHLWRKAHALSGEPIGLDFENMMEDIKRILLPSQKTPIPTAVVLEQMDLMFLEPVLLGFYKKTSYYPPIAMFRGVMLRCKKKQSWRGLRRYLIAYPDEARRLGFIDVDGRIKIPSYEHFRTFAQERVDWDQIRDAIVIELQTIGEENRVNFGSQTVEDATMIETIENDPDGKYNGHYEKKGLKEDIVSCRATGLPLINETIGGTECEGKTLIKKLEHLKKLGIHIKDHWVDGTYATLENIAISHAILGSKLHYQVQEGWVMRKDGKPEHIKRIYQKFWKDQEFRLGASLDEMMMFLATRGRKIVDQGRDLQKTALFEGAWGEGKRKRRGRPLNKEKVAQDRFFESEYVINKGMKLIEPVGAYYRNIVMKKAKKNPEWMKNDKGKRQLSESINNHLKNDLGLQDDLRVKGLKKIHIHNTMGCVFLLLIGLHKIRCGQKRNIASFVGIE